jgi:nicotinamide mononucleotide adenylyltransferase
MHLREIFEADGKTAVFAFGRMNPPTIGHKKLVDKMAGYPGDHFLFLSHTQKPKTDPLSFAEKVFFAQKSFGSNVTVGNKDVKTIIQAMQHLQAQGYNEVVYVAGSDRVESFTKLLNTYNGKDYEFDSIDVISAGERDPDAEGAEGMSASKLKAAAVEDDFETFKQGVAGDERLAQMMFNKVRAGMGVNVVNDSVAEEDLEEFIKKKELVVQQQKPKIDVLNNIAMRSDNKPFPLSWNAGKGEISVGGKVFVDSSNAKKFVSFFDRNEDKQEAMLKALQSASTTAKLFDLLGLKYKLDMER